jgi:DNA polymerase III subunit alpha
MNFVHLHCHTEYSLLDGMPTVDAIVEKAKQENMPAIAITDHGVMHGAYQFYKAAKKAGVKPIIGTEAYLTLWGESAKTKKDRSPYHLLLLARNNVGYQNLVRLSTIAQIDGFYYKPRIDHNLLREYASGIICTSGCLASELPRLITNDKVDEAEARLKWYLETFGENYYLELQDHDLPELNRVNEVLFDWSQRYSIPLVATNDTHYVNADDALPHDVMLCVQTGAKFNDVDRMKMNNNSYYIKSAEEMALAFKRYGPEAISNTVEIANKCDVSLETKGYHLPKFQTPSGTDAEYLRTLVATGFEKRYGINLDNDDGRAVVLDPVTCNAESYEHVSADALRKRVDYELSVISKMAFEKYFLVVWDIIRYAKENGIPWNVRGSAAGSVVAYCLGLTSVEPLSNGLYFERFLNPDRVSMPDIDMDFADDQRYMLVDYAVEKYGAEQVAQIITFGTMQARNAIRDTTRAYGFEIDTATKITEFLPQAANKQVDLQEAVTHIPELADLYRRDPNSRKVIDTALKLEGKIRNAGTHAAGIIIADKPLYEYVPMHRVLGTSLSDKIHWITQYPMGDLEAMGLLKMDYLGLKTLSVVRETCKMIKARTGLDYNLDNIPIHDACIYDLIKRGDTMGVFQLEGAGMTQVVVDMKPFKYEHIIAAVSLYRPGPLEYIPQYIRRMHGVEPVEYRHEDTKAALEETYGIMIYQEQIMKLATDVAGYSMSEADTIRKAVGKKDAAALLKHKNKFIDGAFAKGYSRSIGEQIWADIEFFARYGFNKSHAASYSKLTCQTAWLKANYPLEFLCAYMNTEYEDLEKLRAIIAELKAKGYKVLKPDVNSSMADFSIEGNAIRFGLKAIKELGSTVYDPIVAGRYEPYHNLEDLMSRVPQVANKRPYTALIVSGALDKFGIRRYLLDDVESLLKRHKEAKKLAHIRPLDIFDEVVEESKELIDGNDTIDSELSKLERESIGYNFVRNPDSDRWDEFGASRKDFVSSLTADRRGVVVTAVVKVNTVKQIDTKTGKRMAFVAAEDDTGAVELIVFPDAWDRFKTKIVDGAFLIVTGKCDTENKAKIIVNSISTNPVQPAKEAPSFLNGNVFFVEKIGDFEKFIAELETRLKPGNGTVCIVCDGKMVEIKDKTVRGVHDLLTVLK